MIAVEVEVEEVQGSELKFIKHRTDAGYETSNYVLHKFERFGHICRVMGIGRLNTMRSGWCRCKDYKGTE